jgi:hypothetical protein
MMGAMRWFGYTSRLSTPSKSIFHLPFEIENSHRAGNRPIFNGVLADLNRWQ